MKGTVEERLSALDRLYPVWEEHTLWSRFSVNADRYHDQVYLIYKDNEYTYGYVKEQVKVFARGLYAKGVRPGDHVAVYLYNSPSYLYAIYALAMLGAVKIPMNMRLKEAEQAYILEQSDTDWILGVRYPSEEVLQTVPSLKGVIDLTPLDGKITSDQSVEYNTHPERSAAPVPLQKASSDVPWEQIEELEREHRDPHGLSDIMYTSGSTSMAKGVQLTHDMLLRSSFATCVTRLYEEGRRILVPVPFYHIMAYNECVLTTMHVGGSMVISEGKFDPVHSVELMARHHVNDIVCVSYVMQEILLKGGPKPEMFPDMHAAYWASTCPDWIWKAGREAFGVDDVTTAYGMTECSATTVMMKPTDPESYIHTYVGSLKPAASAGIEEYGGNLLEVRVCDMETGEEVEPGSSGELQARGAIVTPGYYKNPEANRASFTEDGWLRTGDCVSFHENGQMIFEGRIGDSYKVNGENVSPQYVDSVIGQCPGVEAVETVGIRHDKYGAVGVAFIDANDPSEEIKERIEQYCREHLAGFQMPRVFIYENNENWPRTASGKVQKRKLRDRAVEKMVMVSL